MLTLLYGIEGLERYDGGTVDDGQDLDCGTLAQVGADGVMARLCPLLLKTSRRWSCNSRQYNSMTAKMRMFCSWRSKSWNADVWS